MLKNSKLLIVTILLVSVGFMFLCLQVRAETKGKVQTTNKVKLGEWADNGETKLKVVSVKEYTKWSDVPFSKRFTANQQEEFKMLRKNIDSGDAKVIFVNLEAKNIAKEHRNLGWQPQSYCLLYIRGDEGSEQDTSNQNDFTKDVKNSYIYSMGRKTQRFLQDPFPQNAKIAPGATIKGNVAFFVPSWFTPTIFFTKPLYAGHLWGKNEFIVKLK